MLDAADFLLVNRWQRDFPLLPRPFAPVAASAGLSEAQALSRLAALRQRGVIDRIGPVFRPNAVGASLLCAMALPPARLAAAAAQVSEEPGVNHNYEREHRFNLWFVVTGNAPPEVEAGVSRIEAAAGARALRLPLLEEYHIDLGFDLDSRAAPRAAAPRAFAPQSAAERRLVGATAGGLPLVAEPYAEIARAMGATAEEVLAMLRGMLDDGRIRRIGAVVRHRAIGYRANAMAVWDVPDEAIAQHAPGLAREPAVTLCYRRRRAPPEWPYNLYCMVHGRERPQVRAEIERLAALHGLAGLPSAVLFSARCFSQRAALYG